jgi:pSer/pThr/pTyr-binding forkhead associated (FHA) protein
MCRPGSLILCPQVALTLVIDYLTGARHGQRQIVEVDGSVSFGRHPDNIVVFDATADIDASSRHAELVQEDGTYLLRDVGSSNGTWVADEKVEQRVMSPEEAVEVEFGKGGPRVRLWLGSDESNAPAPVRRRRGLRRLLPW